MDPFVTRSKAHQRPAGSAPSIEARRLRVARLGQPQINQDTLASQPDRPGECGSKAKYCPVRQNVPAVDHARHGYALRTIRHHAVSGQGRGVGPVDHDHLRAFMDQYKSVATQPASLRRHDRNRRLTGD